MKLKLIKRFVRRNATGRSEEEEQKGLGRHFFVRLAFEACLVWSEYLMFPLWAPTAAAAGVGFECAGLLQ